MEKEIENNQEWQQLNVEVEDLISTINSEKLNYVNQISCLKSELEKKAKEIDLKNEIIKKNQEKLKKLEEIESENQKLKNIIVDLEKKLESFENVIKEKDLSIITIKSALNDKNFEVEKIWQKSEEAQQEIKQLQSSLLQKDERIAGLLKELEDFRINITKLSASLENTEMGFENKINLLKKELRDKDKEVEEKKLQIKEYLEENKHLKTELEKKNEEFYELKNTLNLKESQISNLQFKLDELENNLKLAQVKYKEPQIIEFQENIKKKNEIISQLDAINRDLESRASALEREKEELNKEIKIKIAEIEKLEENIQRIKKEKDLLNIELNEYKSKNEILLAEKMNFANLLEKKEKERYELYEENRKKDILISGLNSKINELKIIEENLKLDFEKKLKENEHKSSELSVLIKEIQNENKMLSTNLETLEREKIKQREEINKLIAEKDILNTTIIEKEREIEELQKNINLLKSEVKKIEEISKKNDSANKERISFLNKELIAEKERYIKLTSELERVKKAYMDVIEELDVAKNRLVLLTEENKKYKLEKEELLAKREDELEETLKKEKERCATLISNLKELQNKLNEKEEIILMLTNERDSVKREKDGLLANFKELQKKYEEELHAEIESSYKNREAMEEKERQIKELVLQINSLKNEVGQMKIDYTLLLEEKNKMEKHKAKNSKVVFEKDAEIKRLLEIMKEKDRNISEMEKRLEKLQKEKEGIEKGLEEYNKRLIEKYDSISIKNLRDEIKSKDKTIAELKESYEKLNLEFSNFKNDVHTKRNMLPLSDFWEIIAGISHQIANSISIIKSHTQLCLDAPPNFDKEESLNAILRSINALQGKIDEISTFSKPVILQNKYVKLRETLEEAIVSLKKRIDCSNITFDIKEDKKLPELKMDHIRFAKALEEILLNSIDAMEGKGRVEIVIKKSAERNVQLIMISDSGVGIEEGKLKDIFEPFFTTKHQKLGLGLSIAKNIIKAHGGEIEVDSKYGKGTTVYIKMPEG